MVQYYLDIYYILSRESLAVQYYLFLMHSRSYRDKFLTILIRCHPSRVSTNIYSSLIYICSCCKFVAMWTGHEYWIQTKTNAVRFVIVLIREEWPRMRLIKNLSRLLPECIRNKQDCTAKFSRITSRNVIDNTATVRICRNVVRICNSMIQITINTTRINTNAHESGRTCQDEPRV